jgi:hypothetical protein
VFPGVRGRRGTGSRCRGLRCLCPIHLQQVVRMSAGHGRLGWAFGWLAHQGTFCAELQGIRIYQLHGMRPEGRSLMRGTTAPCTGSAPSLGSANKNNTSSLPC